MKRVAFKIAFVGAVVLASAAGPVLIGHWQQVRLRQNSELLQEQAARLAELASESQRLSNLVAQTRTTALPEDQLRELLRLRGEIGPLRQAASELDRLRTTNQPNCRPAPLARATGLGGERLRAAVMQ